MISGIYSAVCIRNAIKPRQISRLVSPGSRTMKEAGERCCCVRSNAVACNFRSLRAVKIFNDRGQKEERERERERRTLSTFLLSCVDVNWIMMEEDTRRDESLVRISRLLDRVEYTEWNVD